MTKPISGIGLAATGIGSILIYAGIKGYSIPSIFQNVVTGKPITTNVSVTNPLQLGGNPVSDAVSNIVSTGVTGSAQAIGKSLAANMGWTGAEWSALRTLWNGESGWNPKAMNKSSGAYGIPQALPYTKMPKPAWPESAGGSSDATAQIQWGLSYIHDRYGTPTAALSAWQNRSPHWY